jgi:hypothetical protein
LVTVKDTWDLPPAYQLNPVLQSDEMSIVESISPAGTNGEFLFSLLPKASYQLQLKYRSFTIEEDISISSSDVEKTIQFPAAYPIELSIFDSRGLSLGKSSITLYREDKRKDFHSNDNGKAVLELPPGDYSMRIKDENGEIIGQRAMNIVGERSYDIMTNAPSILFYVTIILFIALMMTGGLFIFMKIPYSQLIRFFIISILFLSILTPWWTLYGESEKESLSSTTQMYVLPPSLITLTESDEVIAGTAGLDFLPDQLMQLLYFFSIGIACTILLLITMMLIGQKFSTRLRKIIMIVGMSVLILIAIVFIGGVSTLAKLGVGSFLGNGNYDVTIPGEYSFVSINALWGPGIGFYLCLISIIVLLLSYILQYTKLIKIIKK